MAETLQAWTEKLTAGSFPVLQSTIDNLNALYANEEVSYRQLASAVMSDPGMVANTLRAANLEHGQRLHHSIQTVEHALMKLGVTRAAAIHQGLPVLEQLLQQRSRSVRNQVMGIYERSHHAAYQAMDWLRRLGDPEPAEVYVATFLSGLGETLLWLHAPETAAQVRQQVSGSEGRPEEAEQAVLGFTYAQLTRAIVDRLELSPLLSQLLARDSIDTPRCLGMLLGLRLAYLAEQGWYHAAMIHCLGDVAEFLRQPLEVATSITHSNAAQAGRHHQYGIPAAAAFLPLQSGGLGAVVKETQERLQRLEFPTLLSHTQLDHVFTLRAQPELNYEMAVREAKTPQSHVQEMEVRQPLKEGYDTELIVSRDEEGDETIIVSFDEHDRKLEQEGICPVPDEHRLEDSITRLTREIDQSISMPEIMKLVMQGMHDGLGLNRVAFTMLTPDRTMLKTRAVTSLDDDWGIRHLHIPLKPDNLFTHLMSRPQALWLNDDNAGKIWSHVPKELQPVLHKDGFFAMSIYVKSRPIGLFYADRYNHQHRLDEHGYESFKLLCRHASKAMMELSRK